MLERVVELVAPARLESRSFVDPGLAIAEAEI